MKGKKRGRANSDDELDYRAPSASSASTATAATFNGLPTLDPIPQLSLTNTSVNNTTTTQCVDVASDLAVSQSTASSTGHMSSENPILSPLNAPDAGEALPASVDEGHGVDGSSTDGGPIILLIVKHAESLNEDTVEIRSLAVYEDDKMGVYAPRKIPDGLQWNSSSVKNSKLVLQGTDTPVSLWIVDRVVWNGMIPKSSSTGSPGVTFISIDPLVEGDLSKLRDLVTRYSSNGSTADAMNSVRASRMMSYQECNNPDIQVETFGRVMDARDGKVAVSDLDYLDPSFVMQRDVILIEVSMGRFKDTKTKDWSKFRLSLELNAVYVLTQALKSVTDERSPVKKIRHVI
ncbi:hypothetical protein K488DRAFT_90410 [Vararia minispora EC-137]|uniref:Uncharacterized protein n=1 Tax=Vararia minispora EC-137 TaxID=1314806 RepID=A0ACB8Q7Z3_9AGAM|nr:hypothetical protein K488DRAFT_90410 [Vararia minispora EC-137]